MPTAAVLLMVAGGAKAAVEGAKTAVAVGVKKGVEVQAEVASSNSVARRRWWRVVRLVIARPLAGCECCSSE